MVKITVVGTGYVGLVTGTCLAEVGHEVICCDIDEEKIVMLNNGQIPFYEPSLGTFVEKNVKKGRLLFTTYIDNAIRESDVIFSAVGTPPDKDYKADLQYVRQVAEAFAKNLNKYKIFVNKSTVPVGTGDMVKQIVSSITDAQFDVVSNPEFLREGAAVKDFLNPDRIVVGFESEIAKEIMHNIYRPFERMQSPIIFTDIKSAELIKYASNSMLATRISFINEIANFCDVVGADIKAVSKGMGLDNRIGPKFLQAGIGYGGSCFPKDVKALIKSGCELGHEFKILNAVEEVNKNQKLVIVDKIKTVFGDLSGKKIAVWGLSFKPRTDDVREAPAIDIIEKLLAEGAKVYVSDSIAKENFQKQNFHLEINYHDDHYEILDDSDALLLLTEWDEFRILNYDKLHQKMKNKLIFDGRNIYNPQEVKNQGFNYVGIGRGIHQNSAPTNTNTSLCPEFRHYKDQNIK